MAVIRTLGSECRCNGCGKRYIAGDASGWYNHSFCSPSCCYVKLAQNAPKEEDYEDYYEFENASNRYWR